MSDSRVFTPASSTGAGAPQTIVIQQSFSFWRSWGVRILIAVLGISVMFNVSLYTAYQEYFASIEPPHERFVSGSEKAREKIAILTVDGTIMPPFTERLLEQIEHVGKDDSVKGVLLVVDSPGGLVADSHEIYHRLKELEGQKKKPIYVQMKRMAASGGYYISMGAGPAGKIFAEPTTWTGSIGVIIPRYDASKLVEKIGLSSDPLKTGEFKDALNPFRPMTENERKLWEDIMDQSYQTFMKVIDDNRDTLDADGVKELATGRIFTATDAKANGLIDEIGYQEDAIKALQEKLGLQSVRVVKYQSHQSIIEQLLTSSQAKSSIDPFKILVESSIPRAMYLCSWFPALPN